jgi:RNA polymerase sigma-70 factor (ECF subfamily)
VNNSSTPAAGTDSSDLSLVRWAQSGEIWAFDRLVLKYRTQIVELAKRHRLNPADAEDVAQDAFMKAYRGLPGFRCESTFYTWLFRIASNCARNLLKLRARDRFNGTTDFLDDDNAANPPLRLQELETPEELMLTDEIRGTVSSTLEGLSEQQRTAITLREIDGLSYQAIALAMSIPIGTVRSRVFRARDLIDRHLRHIYGGGLGRNTVQRAPQPRSGRDRGAYALDPALSSGI